MNRTEKSPEKEIKNEIRSEVKNEEHKKKPQKPKAVVEKPKAVVEKPQPQPQKEEQQNQVLTIIERMINEESDSQVTAAPTKYLPPIGFNRAPSRSKSYGK